MAIPTELPKELVVQWHATKNELLSSSLRVGSAKRAWWVCSKGHEWEAEIRHRIQRGSGCPYCSNRTLLIGYNDLATTHPHIAAQWNSLKNSILLSEVSAGARNKVWWLGSCGHEWDSKIEDRVRRNAGCPICSNQKVLAGYNDLATVRPDLAIQWHPTLNQDLKPTQIGASSHKKVWWMCGKGHACNIPVDDRTSKKATGCPICSNKQVLSGYNDLGTTFPALVSEWNSIKNGILLPNQFTYGSSVSVWWQCKLGHEWKTIISSRTGTCPTGCPVCSNKQVLAGYNDFATTQPKLASEWNFTKNASLKPTQFTSGSRKKVWWLCTQGHEWENRIAYRATYGCPICVNQTIISGVNDLASKNPNIASRWHTKKNGLIQAHQVSPGSDKKAWWICKEGHEWENRINSQVKASHPCPVCINRKLLVGFNDLATTHPHIAAEWHPVKNGSKIPQDVITGANKKVWWICVNNHEWQSSPLNRTTRNSGCGACGYSKPEKNIYEYVTSLGYIVEQANRKLLKGKELDLYIPSLNLAIEFNGIYWHSESKGKDKAYHYDKWLACKQLGINLLYIWEDDWTKDNNAVLRDIDILLQTSTRAEALVALSKLSTTEQASMNAVVNGSLQSILYALAKHTVTEEIAPDFSYVVKSERVNQPELSDADLVRVDDLPRIWDAGKSVWL